MRILKLSLRIAIDAFRHFIADDGWAIASHIALSTLMALFPFLIVVTALAGFFFGSKELADEAARILLEAWPKEVAGPIALDIAGVLTDTRGDVLTFGVLFAIYFASSGVESLRIGLNRAYDVAEAAAVVAAAAGIDRLCAGRRGGAPGVLVPGGAGAADLGQAACTMCRRWSRSAICSPSLRYRGRRGGADRSRW